VSSNFNIELLFASAAETDSWRATSANARYGQAVSREIRQEGAVHEIHPKRGNRATSPSRIFDNRSVCGSDNRASGQWFTEALRYRDALTRSQIVYGYVQMAIQTTILGAHRVG
jgi:hypothetical protein